MSNTIKHDNTISRKLIVTIILFSSLITAILTVIQLYAEYRDSKLVLQNRVLQIELDYRQSMAVALWQENTPVLSTLLDRIVSIPDIDYAQISVNGNILISKGEPLVSSVMINEFPLTYSNDNKSITVGQTIFESNLSGLYTKLINQTWTILGLNAVKTIFVAIFMFYLLNRLLFLRLHKILKFIRDYDTEDLDRRIYLGSESAINYPDEISEIAIGLNRMQTSLSQSIQDSLSLKKTLDLGIDGIFMFCANSGKFFYTNTGASNLLGYSHQEYFQLTATDLSPCFAKSELKKYMSPNSEWNKRADRIETGFKNKHGDIIQVALRLQYLHPIHEVPRFVFMARDISERKIVEQAVQISLEDAKAANEAKSKFMMSMSHELRTPLNAILGFAQLLKLDAKDLSNEQNESIRDITEGGQRLLKLVENLLDLGTLESDKMKIKLQAVDPQYLVEESVNSLSGLADTHGVRIVNKISNLTLPRIKVDPIRFKQALNNLISNAIKYNRTEGIVTLDVELIRNKIIRIKVSDTGIGISKADRDKLFNRFDRLGLEAGNIEGVGIGLNISRSLIEMMNGQIDFESSDRHGSIFWIDLPYYSSTIDSRSIGMETNALVQ